MKQNLNININAWCRVKPTERGWEILAHKVPHYKAQMGFKDDGYYSSELWYIMWIFGEYMTVGSPNVIDMNIMFEAGCSEVTIEQVSSSVDSHQLIGGQSV